jgi:hypothetical protein
MTTYDCNICCNEGLIAKVTCDECKQFTCKDCHAKLGSCPYCKNKNFGVLNEHECRASYQGEPEEYEEEYEVVHRVSLATMINFLQEQGQTQVLNEIGLYRRNAHRDTNVNLETYNLTPTYIRNKARYMINNEELLVHLTSTNVMIKYMNRSFRINRTSDNDRNERQTDKADFTFYYNDNTLLVTEYGKDSLTINLNNMKYKYD